ncbi:plus-3-domain-containing protein [Punctularia strigosozonata HHB-11173 SS5]|uniref:plus-3-domain-containing protein n=1 Tax=Punctularia strigosozonata (strain HHB-11173) TaxID=741275 RepID=UPI0004416CF6|nr:plus-3-domain-containing protein [Punctularia strigosozonata HHB-11173 SS5]EIN14535.1 plus-3-domain-containing protein [Punctularia strigosozonata HHB-11173 SS5]
MSDSEGDFSDELLELAGATEKKRKRRQNAGLKVGKRRKADVSDDSEDAPESEEDDIKLNPYPLEGKYKDEADRDHLLELTEMEREEILASRLEELQRIQDKRSLEALVKAQKSGAAEDAKSSGTGQHAVRGATKEKSRKLDELKAKRRAKDDKKRTKPGSPKRDRSASPTDMEMSSSDDEDGQITKLDEAEERRRRFYRDYGPSKKKKEDDDDDELTRLDLAICRVTRDMIAKHCMAPWFEDWITGSWVRYLIGQENGLPIYRICEVQNLGADLVKPYRVNDVPVNQSIELKHGKSTKTWTMDKVSNADWNDREFDRLVAVCKAEGVKLPRKRDLEKKHAQMKKLVEQPVTEARSAASAFKSYADLHSQLDLAKELAKRRALQALIGGGAPTSGTSLALEKSRLNAARTVAYNRQDWDECASIEAELSALNAQSNPSPTKAKSGDPAVDGGANGNPEAAKESERDKLARVNERNRRANMEAVRKAEIAEAEKKRLKRKLGLGTPGAGTPGAGTPGTMSPSRPGTPAQLHSRSNGTSTPKLEPIPPSVLTGALSQASDGTNDLEKSVVESLDVDLGDF